YEYDKGRQGAFPCRNVDGSLFLTGCLSGLAQAFQKKGALQAMLLSRGLRPLKHPALTPAARPDRMAFAGHGHRDSVLDHWQLTERPLRPPAPLLYRR